MFGARSGVFAHRQGHELLGMLVKWDPILFWTATLRRSASRPRRVEVFILMEGDRTLANTTTQEGT